MILIKSIFIIVFTTRTEERQKNTNIVFASIAINDLVKGVVLLYYQVATIPFYKPNALWNNTSDSFLFGACYGNVILSFLHLAVLTLDRYVYILHQFFYMKHVTKRRIYLVLLCIWIIGLIYIVIPIFVYADEKYHERCMILHPPVEYFCLSSCVYVFMLIVVFICCLNIACLAFKRRKAANNRRRTATDILDSTIFRSNRSSA
ncbi:unnamed protein product, partial [Candidula unifasciata]